ncbi:hypothetical protein DIPPA_09740 [Diplonema papillatum]|nr:hypothetical protein DIPPA_09740 [Diplonema papillatum]
MQQVAPQVPRSRGISYWGVHVAQTSGSCKDVSFQLVKKFAAVLEVRQQGVGALDTQIPHLVWKANVGPCGGSCEDLSFPADQEIQAHALGLRTGVSVQEVPR